MKPPLEGPRWAQACCSRRGNPAPPGRRAGRTGRQGRRPQESRAGPGCPAHDGRCLQARGRVALLGASFEAPSWSLEARPSPTASPGSFCISPLSAAPAGPGEGWRFTQARGACLGAECLTCKPSWGRPPGAYLGRKSSEGARLRQWPCCDRDRRPLSPSQAVSVPTKRMPFSTAGPQGALGQQKQRRDTAAGCGVWGRRERGRRCVRMNLRSVFAPGGRAGTGLIAKDPLSRLRCEPRASTGLTGGRSRCFVTAGHAQPGPSSRPDQGAVTRWAAPHPELDPTCALGPG